MVLALLLTFCVSAAGTFKNQSVSVGSENGNLVVSGSFDAENCDDTSYYVFVATMGTGKIVDNIEISRSFQLKNNSSNSFTCSFPMVSSSQKVKVYILTNKMTPIRTQINKIVRFDYFDWDVTDENLYTVLASDEVSNDTNFNALIENNDELTIAEGITMASYLHAKLTGADVDAAINKEFKIDFDGDEKEKCTLSYYNAEGSVANGVIQYKPTSSNYDHGLKIEGLELDANKYNKLTVRMKRDYLANSSGGNRVEELEIFFKTNVNPSYSGSRVVYSRIPSTVNMSDWFEHAMELSSNANFTDLITGIRFDSTNNNGVYYIDYIMLSQSNQISSQNWYDKYVDYALENGIIDNRTFDVNKYNDPITRKDLLALFVKATPNPESYYTKKNSINGIPDVNKDDWNADVFLMLYNAGITLGSDSNGNLNVDSYVKESESAHLVSRILNTKNRLSGSVSANWTSDASSYDQEFDKTYSWSFLCPYTVSNADYSVSNGVISIKAKTTDPQFSLKNNTNLDADACKKVIVRLKPKVDGDPKNLDWDFFFKTSEDTSSYNEKRSLHNKYNTYSYVDAAGWWIIEIDLKLQAYWRGTAKNFRFDPANSLGTYDIDYIRFIKNYDTLTKHDELVSAGYAATRFLKDTSFENGFYVCQFEQKNNYEHGLFTYNDTDASPLWQIDPWWSLYDLWENRNTETDKYTLSDTLGINEIKYNPDLGSVSMRLNATNIYKGQPHDSTYNYWPHLLLEQNTNICPVDKKKNSTDVDKLFAEIDVRMTDFKNTTNTNGENSCLYLVYFYLRTDKAPGHKIWFGLTLFENDANNVCGVDWNFDPYSDMMIYRMTTVSTFGDLSKSFTTAEGKFAPGDEWKTLRVDLMPEIRRAVEWANRDNIFGVPVSVEDMYIDGVNIGYEIHGNFDATFEFKNLDIVAYNK